MKKIKYTKYEEEVLDYIENKGAKSIPNLQKEVARYRKIFKNHATKRKVINLRILESDLHKIRTKALAEGIPYQTLISSVIHKFAKTNWLEVNFSD